MRAIVQYYSDDDEVEKIIICIDCIVVYYRPLFYLLIIPGTIKLLCTRYRWYFMIRGEGAGLDVLVRFKEAIELTILTRGIKRGGALRSYKSLNFNFKLNSRMES